MPIPSSSSAPPILACTRAFLIFWTQLPHLQNRGTLKDAGRLPLPGTGTSEKKLKADILGGRFDGAVTLLGRVPRGRIIEELELADVVVLPSRWPENEPVVLLEAMAAGRAQLATRIGGMPDIVQDGVTGTLTEPSNAAALAEAMRSYVLDPSLARRQGNASRARRELHSELAGVDQLEAIYHEICTVPQAIRPTKPLVLVHGDWPLPHVAEMINVLHDVHPPPGIRIVWHEWVNIDAWHNATLLWNSSTRCPTGHHAPCAARWCAHPRPIKLQPGQRDRDRVWRGNHL